MSSANREQNGGVPSVPARGGTGSITRGEVPGQENLRGCSVGGGEQSTGCFAPPCHS